MKRDLKREWKHLYHAKANKVVEVDVPAVRCLMVDGQGDPNRSPAYVDAVEALFSLSYALKFKVKKGPSGIDHAVMPLEGLWWADDMSAFAANDRTQWRWTMSIVQPGHIDATLVEETRAEVARKKSLPSLSLVRFESFEEGHCAQTLHVGPFSEEGPTIERVHAYVEEHGERTGRHHEIYLSDIRRGDPARWKTIIRQPFRPR